MQLFFARTAHQSVKQNVQLAMHNLFFFLFFILANSEMIDFTHLELFQSVT